MKSFHAEMYSFGSDIGNTISGAVKRFYAKYSYHPKWILVLDHDVETVVNISNLEVISEPNGIQSGHFFLGPIRSQNEHCECDERVIVRASKKSCKRRPVK